MFSITNTFGSRCTLAMVSASWKSPREVEPSPQNARHTRSSPRYFAANAIPVATGKLAGMWLGGLYTPRSSRP